MGTARLSGYRWIISTRGYANIVRTDDEEVEGVLYAISAADEIALDGYEGVVTGCYYKETIIVQHEGREMAAMVYIDPTVREGNPKKEYVGRMAAALLEADLSASYVAKYMGRFIVDNR
jgi:cation transport regulator ChaC